MRFSFEMDMDKDTTSIVSIVIGLTIVFCFMVVGAVATAAPTKLNRQVRIAIIDTGYNPEWQVGPKLKLCEDGHYDFAARTNEVGFKSDHGTIVASIIATALEKVDYCAIIYQVEKKQGDISLLDMTDSFNKALAAKADVVNVSLSGRQHTFLEKAVIEHVSQKGMMVFVAAGNNNLNLDDTCVSYPACYLIPNVRIVGAMSPDLTQKADYSNFGSVVTIWYPGTVKVQRGYAHGTSFATPAALADYVLSLVK